MLAFALGTGIISYILFVLGILGLFNLPILAVLGIGVIIFYVLLVIKYKVILFLKNSFVGIIYERSFYIKSSVILIGIILFLNLIVALSPERGFDALWYHLVIPKVFLQEGALFYIPGSLLYYSPMPKLVDLLYILPLAFHLDFLTRIMSFGFGILTLFVTYSLAILFVNRKLAFLVIVLLVSNVVFSWQMTTAYIDMARTFFETLAILTLLRWMKSKDSILYIESALCMGLAIATKVISITTLFSLVLFLGVYFLNTQKSLKAKALLSYTGIALLVVLPWWLFAWVHTGNPFFPLLSSSYSIGFNPSLLSPITYLRTIWNVFTASPDPVSPLYLLILPIAIALYGKFKRNEKAFALYSFLLLLAWYFTPNTGGGRFILSYLPVFSVVFFITFQYISNKFLQRFLFISIVFVVFLTFASRLFVAGKVLPVVSGFETRDEYLSKNLNFSYGDFYDIDNRLGNLITSQDIVLVYGVHNLHYINFRYIHESWAKSGDIFNYILTQNTNPPEEFYFFKKIYSNPITNVALYYGGGFWEY